MKADAKVSGAKRFSPMAGSVAINLSANLLQGLFGIALIPLATRVLGPEDYGVYGMAIVLIGLVGALCETGATYLLYGHFTSTTDDERRSLISSLLCLSITTGVLAGILLWAVWPLLDRFDSILASLTPLEKMLACLSIPCRTVWAIASPILISQMRSTWVAACISLQAITGFTVVLLSLYVFGQDRASLFWGNMSSAAAGLGLALFVIGRSAWAIPRLHWLSKVVRMAPGAWLAGVADNVRATIESGAMARATGSEGLGNYNHARLHYGLLLQGTNAFANVLWPLALQEAKDRTSQFLRIRLAWNFVYLCLTLAGLVFVYFGGYIVHLLTNGKFDQAAAWIPFLIIYLLIQNSGKPATAVLYAANRGNTLSAMRITCTGAAVLAIVLLVPDFGVPAAIAIGIAEMSIMRMLIQISARRIQPIPFQDQWVLLGCAVISATWLLVHTLALSVAERTTLFALTCSMLLLLAGRSIAAHSKMDTLSHLRALFRK